MTRCSRRGRSLRRRKEFSRPRRVLRRWSQHEGWRGNAGSSHTSAWCFLIPAADTNISRLGKKPCGRIEQMTTEATERLYYRDSFLREFDAQVISCEKEGERWKVVLDRTAFYPTSGGQPSDTGKLGDVPVIEVADAEQKVVHYASAAVPVGPVHGVIDWPRRIDHMQQHTGQHLLSAAFIELFGFQTVSFHLGREISTIDLDTPAVIPKQLEEAERRVNEVIFEDKPVVIRFGTAEELVEAGIRKNVEREGILRAIEVEGFDRQPCGGTHLERTGQAGLLLIRKLERRRDQCRVEFVCGFRALAAARSDFST